MEPAVLLGAQVDVPVQQNSVWAQNLWHVFSLLFDAVNARLDNGINLMIGAQIDYVNGVIFLAAALALMWAGVMIAVGAGSLQPAVRLLIRLALVLEVIGQAPRYQQYVMSTASALPGELSNVVMSPLGAGNFQGAEFFDASLNSAWSAVAVTFTHTPLGMGAVFVYFALVLAVIVIFLCVAASFLVWFVSVLVLKLALGFGVLFIAAAAFESTRGVFDRWVALVLSSAFVQVLSVTCIMLLGAAETQTTDQIVAAANEPGGNYASELQGILVLSTLAFILAVLVKQTPMIAGHLFSAVSFGAAPYSRAMAAYASNTAATTAATYRGGRAAVDWARGR